MKRKNGKKKTLIIEDDMVGYQLIHELVAPHTDEIVRLSNGLEAVNYLKRYGTDLNLVIVDILLPKLDGIEVIKTLRQNDPMVPVIGVSASTQANKGNQCYKAGCDMFFLKPIDVDHFENIISTYLEMNPQTT
jgi:two-component system capsular synthesis sensor histidine kinase RcsC